MERMPVDSDVLGRTLEQGVFDPGVAGRPLLVLLHGRGSNPVDVWTLGLRDGLERLGSRAPAVLLVDGGDHSYYHDRRDGPWGDYVFREAIPAALERLRADPDRIAIGGISMGGFGALDLARLHPARFCAVGGHSPALWVAAIGALFAFLPILLSPVPKLREMPEPVEEPLPSEAEAAGGLLAAAARE